MAGFLLFLFIFGILVAGHEFGHFFIARQNNIRVREFNVGFGPKLLSKRIRGTDFNLRLFPIGGACVFDPPDAFNIEDKGEESIKDDVPENGRMNFEDAGVWARIATVLGGPAANVIMAVIISSVIAAFAGVDMPIVGSLVPGGAAEQAGIEAGDEIVRINGHRVYVYRDISLTLLGSGGKPVTVEYKRDYISKTTAITPLLNQDTGRYVLGIYGNGYTKCNALQVFEYGIYDVRYWLRVTFTSLQMLFSGNFTLDDLSGPVGIAQEIDNTYESARPEGAAAVILSLMKLSSFFSVNLGIMNLLPLPALDGGRLITYLVEAVRKKKTDAKAEAYITVAGAIVLCVLMVVVMVNDIFNLAG